MKDGRMVEQDELIELVEEELKARDKLTEKPKVKDVLFFLGFDDGSVLADKRTLDIISKFEYLRYSPTEIKNKIWFESYTMLSLMQPRL